MKSEDPQHRMAGAEGGPSAAAAHGASISASKQAGQPANRKHSSSNMKRQKSIKLNLNDAAAIAKGNIGLRKSSEIIQDTFRAGESQERIIQQTAAAHVQSLPAAVMQDPSIPGAAGNEVEATASIVNRGGGSAGDATASMGTADRNR